MKKILLLAFTVHFSVNLFSQLNKVPPLTSVVQNSAKVENLNLLVNTKDFTNIFLFPLPDVYATTVQLVHAANPFPPIWYQIGTHSVTNTGHITSDFYLDPLINEKSGRLSYNFLIVPDSLTGTVKTGFVILDTTTMEPVDTLTGNSFAKVDSTFDAVDNHEYVEDEHHNKMFYTGVRTTIDARCLSGNPADTAMSAEIQYIMILDSVDNVVFVWNPLDHMSACEMHWEWRQASTSYVGALNMSHGNSLSWANDGNILYSYRHIGIGKININTGDIMFKLGGKDSAFAIPLPDSIGYSLQHNFYQRPDGKYSLFSNGDDSIRPYMEGLIYDIDELNKTVQLVYRYRPNPICVSRALGSFVRHNGMYFLNRGLKFCFSTNQMVDIINESDEAPIAQIFGPAVNFSYRAYATEWNISRRPSVTIQGNSLVTDSISGLYDYTWYKVTAGNAVKVGNGLSYIPSLNAKYVVEAKAGRGDFTSFLLSDPVNFVLTSVRNSVQNQIHMYYNPENNTAMVNLKETEGSLRIINVNGQIIKEAALTNGNNEVYFRNSPGIYIFDVTTSGDHVTAKVFVN